MRGPYSENEIFEMSLLLLPLIRSEIHVKLVLLPSATRRHFVDALSYLGTDTGAIPLTPTYSGSEQVYTK